MQTQRYSFTVLGMRNDTSSLKDIFAETLKRQNDGCNHRRSNRERVMDAEFDFFIPPSTGDNRVARREDEERSLKNSLDFLFYPAPVISIVFSPRRKTAEMTRTLRLFASHSTRLERRVITRTRSIGCDSINKSADFD